MLNRRTKIIILALAIVVSPMALLQEAHAMNSGAIPYSETLWTAEVMFVIVEVIILIIAIIMEAMAAEEDKKNEDKKRG